MENHIAKVEMDTSAYIDEHGVSVCIYMGEGSCDPIIEHTFDWETMVENYFESYTVGDKIREMDMADAALLVTKLEQLALYAKNMLEDYAEQDVETPPLSREDFIE